MNDPQALLDEAIQSYYTSFEEDSRLTARSVGGRLELARMRALLASRLAPGSRVLDVGGATGVHAAWLAEHGHDVTLVDPVPAQVEAAAAIGTFEAVVGDARALPVPDESVDLVLLAGPLYHLIARDDRIRALAEARRVLRSGGTLFAQAIGRLTAFADSVRVGGFEAVDEDDLQVLRTGEWTNPGPGFPGGHFHTACELRGEVEEAGFGEVTLHGLEGPNLGVLELVVHDAELERAGLHLAESAEAAIAGPYRDVLADASPHLLAIAVR